MDGVWVAIMQSEHFEWKAVGKTEEESVEAIVHEWNCGRGYTNRVAMTREEMEDYYGINRWFIKFGQCQWE